MTLHSLRHSAVAALTLAAMTLAACSSEADDPVVITPEHDTADMTLRLQVSLGQNGATTSRADNGNQGFEPPVSDFEKVGTLRVIILHPDGKKVEGNRMVRVDDNLNPVNDNLEFEVKSNELKHIYLIANESSLSLPYGVDATKYPIVSQWLDSFAKGVEYNGLTTALNDWTTGYNTSGDIRSSLFAGKERMPITEKFRVLSIKSLSESNGVRSAGNSGSSQVVIQKQQVNLFITRAAAKATFQFELDGYKGSGVNVTGVKINGLSQREYVFPYDPVYNPSKYTDAGETAGIINEVENNERYITSFRSPSTNGTVNFVYDEEAGFAPFELKASSVPDHGPIYFPESMLASTADKYSVSVQLDGKEWLPAKPLETNILEVGGKQAIARNTHLYIKISFGETGITWQAIEAPYNSVELKPEFGNPISPYTGTY